MKRCMVVDDSPVIRKVVKRILSDVNLVVDEAETGARALEICRTGIPDLIILDSNLPDMQPSDIISAIRSMPDGRKSRIILCLPEVDLVKIMRAKRAGASGYILKPFDRAMLMHHFSQISAAA
jgi:two-component system, chemotaxis family, chemotaxis protein CheY